MSLSVHPFTDAGLPNGSGAEVFYEAVARQLLDSAEPDGWDQPGELWAIATPAATQAATDPAERARIEQEMVGGNPDGFIVGYGIRWMGRVNGHPRTELPGLTVTPDIAAVALVVEGWRSPDPAAVLRGLRPSQDPDRIETRTVMVMDRSGVAHDYRRDRGSTEIVPVASGLDEGRVPKLLARVMGVPVRERLTVGQLLGRAALARLTAQIQHMRLDPAQAASASLPFTALTLAGIVDALDAPWLPVADIPNLGAILTVDGPRFTAVQECLDAAGSAESPGPHAIAGTLAVARRIAEQGWDGFWARPGSHRWCYLDEADELLDRQRWDWYGSGLRVELIDDRVPNTEQALAGLRAVAGPAAVDEVLAVLTRAGWDPRPGDAAHAGGGA